MVPKIKLVWEKCASNLVEIRKSMKEFPGGLCAVKELAPPSNLKFLLQSVPNNIQFFIYFNSLAKNDAF